MSDLQQVDNDEAIDVLTEALKTIVAWELPETGKYWDDDKTRQIAYGTYYGSKGERDFMRNVAHEALLKTLGGPL